MYAFVELGRERWLAITGVLLITLLLVPLFPYGISAYHVEMGGRAIDLARSTLSETPADLGGAVTHLERALRWREDNAQAYWLLSQAYMMQEDPARAVQALAHYTALRSGNPQGWWELARIYVQMDLPDEAQAAWLAGGFNTQNAISALGKAWETEHYKEVLAWYELASTENQELPTSIEFRAAIAAILTNQPILEFQDPDLLVIHPVSNSVQIEAETWKWLKADPAWGLDYGDSLGDHTSPEYPNAGVMWWAGTAVAAVQISHRDPYRIQIRAKDTPPGPIALQVECDLVPLARFTLGKGDQTWHELETVVTLPAGVHLIGIRFLEDTGDAVLDWIRLQRVIER